MSESRDTAVKSLNHILESGEYSVIPNVVVFDAHDEHDSEGKLRRFDKAALEKIVKKCNSRAQETGDLSPIGPGHTISDAPEHLQPPTYGYAKDFRVGTFGPDEKLGILCSFHVKKTVTTPDGREVDGLTEVKSYPRRSIELWLKDAMIDHIALLRRTPQRDLGLLAFEMNRQITIPSTGNLYSSAKKDYSYAAAVRGGKLCYAMEPDMPIPAMAAGSPGAGSTFIPGNDNGGDDQDYEKFCMNADKYMKAKFGDNLLKYQVSTQAAEGDPMPADPTKPPVAKPDDDVVKMSRQFATADKKVQVAMFERLAQRLAAVEQNSQLQAQTFSEEDAISRVARCAARGCVMDPAREKLEFMKKPLGKERDEYEKHIATYYQKDAFAIEGPIRGLDFLNTGPTNGNGVKKFSREDADKVREQALAKGLRYEEARRELYPDSK